MIHLLFLLGLITGEGRRDFYGVLGLMRDCSERDIDRAFQRLSRKFHPDKNKGDAKAAEKFTDINDAYATLKDAQKRRIFDLYAEPGVHIYESPGSEASTMHQMTHSDDPMSSQSIIRRKGKKLRIVFPVDLVDFYNSNQYDIAVTRRVMCRCPNAGFFCTKCRAKATMRENAKLSLFIEKGSDEGSVTLFKNAGDTSEANAPGDIEVEVVSRPHPVFRRVGSDLHVDVELTLREALFGFKRTFLHVDGSDVVVETDQPIDNDRTVRIKGKGMPLYLYPGDFGDIVVHGLLKWPKNLSQAQLTQIADVLKASK